MCLEEHDLNWMTTPQAMRVIRDELREKALEPTLQLALSVLTLNIPRSCDVTTMTMPELEAALAELLRRSMNFTNGTSTPTQSHSLRLMIGNQPVDVNIAATPVGGQVHPIA